MTPILQNIFGDTVQAFNTASAGLVMGVMILPMVASMSEDALSAVPDALRRASYGLGATKFETTAKIVLPASLSGVIAAFILAISRAIGETMIVTIAAGAGPKLTANPFEGAQTMTGYIAAISQGETAPLIVIGAATRITKDPTLSSKFTVLPIQIFHWTSEPDPAFQNVAAAAILILLVLLLTMNSIAIILRNRFSQRF